MVPLLLVGFAVLALAEAPSLIQKQYWRELFVFAALWTLGLVASILMAAGVQFPFVSTSIEHFLVKIFHL